MKQDTKRILVYVINTIILLLNSVVTFIQQGISEKDVTAQIQSPTAIEREFARG